MLLDTPLKQVCGWWRVVEPASSWELWLRANSLPLHSAVKCLLHFTTLNWSWWQHLPGIDSLHPGSEHPNEIQYLEAPSRRHPIPKTNCQLSRLGSFATSCQHVAWDPQTFPSCRKHPQSPKPEAHFKRDLTWKMISQLHVSYLVMMT